MSLFGGLFDSERLTDCTISAEGQHLRAHKIILSACSPYLEELFTENSVKHPVIILHDVKYDVLKALMDFMYHGEVNVPQKEFSGVLKLSESLQIRGLSHSGCIDDVNIQKGSGRNALSVPPETLPFQPASVSCFTPAQNEAEEKMEPYSECYQTVLSQERSSVEVDLVPNPFRKYEKNINHCGSDQRAGRNVFEDVITRDCDSNCRLPSRQQILSTSNNPTGGAAFSPVPHHSKRSQLQISREELTFDLIVAEKEQFSTPETVLIHQKPANLNAHPEEIPLETESEVPDSHVEVVEVQDSDDDQDDNGGDYPDDDDSAHEDIVEGRTVSEDVSHGENFHTGGMNSLQSLFGSDYMHNVTLASSPTALHCRFVSHSCGKSYKYHRGLKRHLKYYCGKEPQFQCPRCNKHCARRDELKAHMSTSRCQMQGKYCTL
ncbi:longitudinals lacking protein, isoforms N/O/W/X/Y-like isoform X8 [Schistocerca americana]|uniref:longitudinals lacking protein, isoforms N/O/W/X/Y-like isoform X8 n=1 Tax=Schistocerca americana TaxID=7009 RepID=UPI001F4FC663|nr:longitudinals lacking protein, isoforms N/O/W/X/Y-like isoform X8 [Schistocerca americana]